MRRIILWGMLLFSALVSAEQQGDNPPQLEAAPEAPEPPLPVQSGEELEPDITIIRRGDKMIHEYRQNGVLYMVKIIPDIGPPYYLIDSNGDGNLDVRRSEIETGTRINQWQIFSWK
jgi:hypothetical protein